MLKRGETMQRRHLIQQIFRSGATLAGLGTGAFWHKSVQAQPASVQITWLHHSCVLFEGEGRRILVNPFRQLGCTAGYSAPHVLADLVLISSRLFDEGFLEGLPGSPQILFQPGDYQIQGMRVQGVRMAHDNTTPRGERFGINVGWRWTLAGLTIVHLGGAAAPMTREQEILLRQPDLLFIPVGGGPKNYDPQGAQAAITVLQPKLVIPTMYRTSAADDQCELVDRQAFLNFYPASQIRFLESTTLTLSPAQLPSGLQIWAFPETA